MYHAKAWRYGLGIALGLFLILGLLLLWLKKTEDQSNSRHSPSAYTEPASSKPKDQGPATGMNQLLTDNAPELEPLASMRQEIAKQGNSALPVKTNPVYTEYETTAKQDITELIADMAHPNTTNTTPHMGRMVIVGGLFDLSYSIPRSIKVMRILELGRQDKQNIVVSQLQQSITQNIDRYEEAIRQWEEQIQKGIATDLNGGHYDEQTFRYDTPEQEVRRLRRVIYASFYLLANIQGIQNTEQLARWISLSDGRSSQTKPLDLWLVDSVVRHGQAAQGEFSSEYLKLVPKSLTDTVITLPAWDVYNEKVGKEWVDLKYLKSVNVMAIPQDPVVDEKTTDQVLKQFVEHFR